MLRLVMFTIGPDWERKLKETKMDTNTNNPNQSNQPNQTPGQTPRTTPETDPKSGKVGDPKEQGMPDTNTPQNPL